MCKVVYWRYRGCGHERWNRTVHCEAMRDQPHGLRRTGGAKKKCYDMFKKTISVRRKAFCPACRKARIMRASVSARTGIQKADLEMSQVETRYIGADSVPIRPTYRG